MLVAHLTDRFSAIGGVQTYLRGLVPALAERGIRSVVIAGERSADDFEGAPVLHVGAVGSDRAKLTERDRLELRAAIADARPDVVYAHYVLSPAVVTEACAAVGTLVYAHDYFMRCPGSERYLHTRQAFCAEGPGLRCLGRAYLERCTNRRPDRLLREYGRVRSWYALVPGPRRVLVASPFVARVLEAGGVAAEQIAIVPYPVAPPAASTSRPDDPAPTVLYVGRLTGSKGVDVLIEALARLDSVSATIAGDGPARESLERLARRLGVAERIRFVGWVSPPERSGLFARASVLAMPSLWQEPFGIVGLEALAAGVPVVASAVGGIPSWLRDGEAGLLVPASDPARLADALGRVVGDPTLRARLSEKGPEAAARHSMKRHLELLLPELRRAMG